MICWHCGCSVEKVGFRSTCARCSAYLHACKGCKYYQVGLTNDCRVPGTDRVVDREGNNFCEEFSPKEQGPSNGEEKFSSKNRFDDLFR